MEDTPKVRELHSFVDKAISCDEVIEYVNGVEVPEGATLFIYSNYGFSTSDAVAYRISTVYLALEGLSQVAEFLQTRMPGFNNGKFDKVYIQREGALFNEYDRNALLARINALGELGSVGLEMLSVPLIEAAKRVGAEIPRTG